MAKFYYDRDANLDDLKDLTVAIIGYGNQGRAHALNLRDSQINVRVGTRPGGASFEKAKRDGFIPQSVDIVAEESDILALMLPDEVMTNVFNQSIKAHLHRPKTLVFAHGFCVRHKLLELPKNADILLVAPTGPGRELRNLYKNGKGLPALLAVEQDVSGLAMQHCLAYAKALGSTRAGSILTTFEEETVVDLFCEQAVLCGGLPELIKKSFDTLVAAGYQPELAYISCLKEVKLIADLLFELGVDGMRHAISGTAKYGSLIAGPKIIDEHVGHKLKKVLRSIESREFAQEYIEQSKQNSAQLKNLVKIEKNSRLVKTGKNLQERLSF